MEEHKGTNMTTNQLHDTNNGLTLCGLVEAGHLKESGRRIVNAAQDAHDLLASFRRWYQDSDKGPSGSSFFGSDDLTIRERVEAYFAKTGN